MSVGKQRQFLWLTIVVMLVGMTACGPRETELLFESIEQRQTAGTGKLYESEKPGLMIIAQPEGLTQVNDLVTASARAQLEKMDFDTYFAVIAFLGWQPNSHEGVRIEHITRRAHEVSILARFGRPGGSDVVTSPYHLVKVRKEDAWDEVIEFTLRVQGTVVASVSHTVP